jgi:hypothetical protein
MMLPVVGFKFKPKVHAGMVFGKTQENDFGCQRGIFLPS